MLGLSMFISLLCFVNEGTKGSIFVGFFLDG